MRASLRFTFVCAFVAIATSDAMAQTARLPNLDRGSVEIALHIGRTQPAVTFPGSEPGRPTTLMERDESFRLIWVDLSARVYWTRRISTEVRVGATSWDAHGFSIPRPPGPPSLGTRPDRHTVRQHRRAFSAVQSIDLISGRRIVPWVGGGVLFHRTSTRDVLEGFRFHSWTRRSTNDTTAIGAAGVKVYVNRRAFVSVNGLARLGDAPVEGFAGQWQIGGGVAF